MIGYKWAQTLVLLTGGSITLYARKINVDEIVFNCRSFPNVPLIEYKGCISYNPTLALRQLGYPVLGKLEDKVLEEFDIS